MYIRYYWKYMISWEYAIVQNINLNANHEIPGSTSSDTASNEDKNGPGNGPHSPTPSSSSSQGTVKRSPNSATNSVISNNVKNNENSVKSTGNQLVRPRHLKQRKEVFKVLLLHIFLAQKSDIFHTF